MQKKRIMISALALVVVALVASWGVNAYFNDVENNAGNKVTAATLDLQVTSPASNVTAYLTQSGVYPGFTSAIPTSITLKNNGSMAGLLTVTIVQIVDTNGTDTEPELVTTGNANGVAGVATGTGGDLSEVLSITITAGTFTYTGLLNGAMTNLANIPMAAGSTLTFTVSFSVPTSADNQIQGDIVTFGLRFVLNQDADGNAGTQV
ncbi:MAG TPA: SipW-dependent-type signal peptide-containing protein [Methanomassiliicoccales archaeon]|nr:hypothetical protein [Methanomassiliicoccales archaeon]HNX48103.1 SipW-dependent-type signal peptide-containing protein [Methanomassiliicoccales archaeon]HPR98309.1 SipW-dependent-type signal peptide-containing protein [Methanomassiliicoccales archaeon]